MFVLFHGRLGSRNIKAERCRPGLEGRVLSSAVSRLRIADDTFLAVSDA